MGLLDSINQHNAPPRGTASINAKLSADEQHDLRIALSNPGISHIAIVRGLKEHDVDVTEATVRRWRERPANVDGL